MYSWFWFGIFLTKIHFTVSDYVSVVATLSHVEINCKLNHLINITKITAENPTACGESLSQCNLNTIEFTKITTECNKKRACQYAFSTQHEDCYKQIDTRFKLTYLCPGCNKKTACEVIKKGIKLKCNDDIEIAVQNVTVFLDQGHCSNCNCTKFTEDILQEASNNCDRKDECKLDFKGYEKHPCVKSSAYFAVYYTCIPEENRSETKTAYTYAAILGCIFAFLALVATVLVLYRYRKNASLSHLFMHKSLDNTSDTSLPESRRYGEINSNIDMTFPKNDNDQETTLSACSKHNPEILGHIDYFMFDPKETGYNRIGYSPNKINNTITPTSNFSASIIDQQKDPYTETTDYDHTHCNRHPNIGNNIYSRAIDSTYDTAKHTKEDEHNNSDDYDHFAVTNLENNQI